MSTHNNTNERSSTHQRVRDNYVKKSPPLTTDVLFEEDVNTEISDYQNRKEVINLFKNWKDIVGKEDLASVVGLDAVLVSSIDDFKLLKHQWNDLYSKCERNTIFSSWEWMFTWWEVFKDQCQRKLYILCFYQYDQLVGIAPFQIDKSYPQAFVQGRTLRFIGLGDSRSDRIVTQYLDFMVLPSFESEVIKSASDFLVQHKKDWDFADFEYLLENSLIFQCFTSNKSKIARQKVEYGVRYLVSNVKSFDAYKENMGSRWRKMFVKKDRLLTRDGDVKIQTTNTYESIEPALKQLSAMNCARWKGKVDYYVFESSKFFEFHEKIIKRLMPQNKASIKTLLLDEEVLASYYVFSDKGQVHYYQSGFYSKYANRYSPLFILVCKEIGAAIGNKQLFDFMYTDTTDSYKKTQYAASSEKMYRLRWASLPIRLFLFKCAKAVQVRLLNSISSSLQLIKKTIIGK